MSYVVMSFAKRCGSTSYAWQWSRRLFVGLTMMFPLPFSQSVAATPFCGVELNLTSVDFSDHGSQHGFIDAPNYTARLKADSGAFGAEKSSNAEMGLPFTWQSSGPAKTIFSGVMAVGRLKGSSDVNEGQVSDSHEGPVALTMTVFKSSAARADRCTHMHEPCVHEGPLEGD